MNLQYPCVSDCLAGCGNQTWFKGQTEQSIMIGRSYFRLFSGGDHPYMLLFTGNVDTTFADGLHSKANDPLDYTLHNVRIGLCDTCDMRYPAEPASFYQLFFQGSPEKHILDGDTVFSDPITLHAQPGQFLCTEITFSGKRIPCHPEIGIPAFRLENSQWVASSELPFPGMIGCVRPVDAQIVFLGDSITQGIGTPPNSYTHWNAVLAKELGQKYAFWNLGIGYARAADAASDGQWMQKAINAQVATVCFGVNDVLQGATADQLIHHLYAILTELQSRNIRVLLQTIPPFDMAGVPAQVWSEANDRIRNELFPLADAFFDAADLLKKDDDEPLLARFGGHPDAEGCAVWAEALVPVMQSLLTSVHD